MLIAIYLLIFASIILLAWPFFFQEKIRLSPELRKEFEDDVLYKTSMVKKPLPITLPFFWLNRLILAKMRTKNLSDKLSSAEINILPEDFLGIKELIIIVGVLAVFLITKKVEPLWIAIVVVLGLLLPDIILKLRIKKRNRLIVKALPEAIDLLTLCVEGGLDFMLGLSWVIRRSKPNPLIKEITLVIHEIKVGRSRHEALKAMAKRLNIPEVFSFVNVLVHAERMGTPIYEVLVDLSEEARRRRFQRGERLALQAPIKMLFPLIFFILPVVGIIVGAPILLQFLEGGLPTF